MVAMRVTLATAVSAVALVLTGCGGDPATPAPFTPSPSVDASSPSSSDSTSPGPEEPTLPAAAVGADRAAARAFVAYYVELINYAQATGNVAGLRRASTQDCRACRATTRSVSKLYREGGQIEGGAWRIRSWAAVVARPGSQHGFEILVRTSEQTVKQSGEKPVNYSGGIARYRIYVASGSDDWSISWLETV
jgi:hypothetical protein